MAGNLILLSKDFVLKQLYEIGPSILTWCIPTKANSYKPVKIWTQLVIKVAKEKEKKTPLLHKFVCFQMTDYKGLQA